MTNLGEIRDAFDTLAEAVDTLRDSIEAAEELAEAGGSERDAVCLIDSETAGLAEGTAEELAGLINGRPEPTPKETAHDARNRAAVDAWTFAKYARERAYVVRTARARIVAARALRVARLAARVCL